MRNNNNIPPDVRCAKCGHRRDEHNYRHRFVAPDGVERRDCWQRLTEAQERIADLEQQGQRERYFTDGYIRRLHSMQDQRDMLRQALADVEREAAIVGQNRLAMMCLRARETLRDGSQVEGREVSDE